MMMVMKWWKEANFKTCVKKRKVYILGDSNVKGIKHWKMQSKGTKVVVRSIVGATVRQKQHYAKPAEEDNPSLYILHVGTHNLKTSKSVEEIADEITNLACSIRKSNNEVTVSGICPRGDHLKAKAADVNEIMKQRCKQNHMGYIKHPQLDTTLHKNGNNLHLNHAGDTILAKSYIREICMWLVKFHNSERRVQTYDKTYDKTKDVGNVITSQYLGKHALIVSDKLGSKKGMVLLLQLM